MRLKDLHRSNPFGLGAWFGLAPDDLLLTVRDNRASICARFVCLTSYYALFGVARRSDPEFKAKQLNRGIRPTLSDLAPLMRVKRGDAATSSMSVLTN